MLTDDLIRCVPLFAMLPEDELEALARGIEETATPAETLLFKEGETGGQFYILIEGEVDIIKAMGTDDERLLAVREPCSFLGELSLFSEDGAHTASVRARTDLQLMELSRNALNELLKRQPAFAYEMIRTLSKRLVETEDLTIRDLRRKNRELKRLYEELKAAQEQIIEKERYEKELEVARTIQMSILPQRPPEIPRFSFFARMEAMASVGGDFFDFIELDDHRVGVVIGDVSDHGVPAALFMALSVTLLRAEAKPDVQPAAALRRVNRLLLNMNEAGMFVTLLYGILNTDTYQFSYARAGHEYPFLLKHDGSPVEFEQATGQPLGLFADLILDEGQVDLPEKGMLSLYTDGITNAINARSIPFGQGNLLSVLKDCMHEKARTSVDKVWSAVKDHRGEEDQHDDLTLLILKAK
jgi:serine phosphatase RsbU (regulator of sigma subunit)